MKPDRIDVVVVGAGLAGLTTAWHLNKAGRSVVLLEAADAVGGCIATVRRDGFLLEKGPFNVMVRDPSFQDLLEEFEDQVAVVSASKSARARYIYRQGRLHKVPTNPIALLTTGLLSLAGRIRLLTGMFLSPRALPNEETMEQVATRRFGRETSDVLVSSVISGVFAGDIKKLGLRSCFPTVAGVDSKARSLIGFGLTAAFRGKGKKKHKRRWRGLVSIDGGLGALTDALGGKLGDSLQCGCAATAFRSDADGIEVDYTDRTGATQTVLARRLVLACPAQAAQRLLQPHLADVADDLGTIQSSSLTVLNLAFRRADIAHPLQGFGFLVPHHERDFPLMGVLWADTIFPHHAPDDHRLIRVFIGGARDPGAVDRTDKVLVDTAMKELRGLLQISGDPVLVDVARFAAAIPQYHVGHTEKIKRIRERAESIPALTLSGNYLEGVSLNDCVRLGSRVAQELIQELGDLASRSDSHAEVRTTPTPTQASS